MHHHWFRRGSIGGLLTIAAALVGCGSGDDSAAPGPNPTALTAAKASSSGDGQSGAPSEALAQPLRIVVMRGGTPEANVAVDWSASGTGSIAPSGATDASGIASAVWTLGQEVGSQTAQAAVMGASGSPVAFSATAVVPGGGGAQSATVVLRSSGGNRFDPSQVTIGVGGTVTWVWGDGIHDVTSTGAPSFASSGAPNGPPRSYPVTFNTAGVYDYECTVHAGMTGRVTVQ